MNRVRVVINGKTVDMPRQLAETFVRGADAEREYLDKHPRPGSTTVSRQRAAERRAFSFAVAKGR